MGLNEQENTISLKSEHPDYMERYIIYDDDYNLSLKINDETTEFK